MSDASGHTGRSGDSAQDVSGHRVRDSTHFTRRPLAERRHDGVGNDEWWLKAEERAPLGVSLSERARERARIADICVKLTVKELEHELAMMVALAQFTKRHTRLMQYSNDGGFRAFAVRHHRRNSESGVEHRQRVRIINETLSHLVDECTALLAALLMAQPW